MRRGDNLGDTYSRATSFACFDLSLAPPALNSIFNSLIESMLFNDIIPDACTSLLTSIPTLPHPFFGDLVSTINLIYSLFLFLYGFLPTLCALQE